MTDSKISDAQLRELLCTLLTLFYAKDWVSGTGGGICARRGDGMLLVAPTGVHKELVRPEDLFALDPKTCAVVEPPKNPALAPSECSSIFAAICQERGAGSVVHSHSLSSVLAADLTDGHDTLTIGGLEMLKGIRDTPNTAQHAVPVIGNTARESDLTATVTAVARDARYANSHAILVRDHGAYIWGSDIWEAKRHAEVYHFLFQAMVQRRRTKG